MLHSYSHQNLGILCKNQTKIIIIGNLTINILQHHVSKVYDKPVLDSNYPMAVAMLQAPTRLHQNCKYLTSHLMAHHEELLEPSTQASGEKNGKIQHVKLKVTSKN